MMRLPLDFCLPSHEQDVEIGEKFPSNRKLENHEWLRKKGQKKELKNNEGENCKEKLAHGYNLVRVHNADSCTMNWANSQVCSFNLPNLKEDH